MNILFKFQDPLPNFGTGEERDFKYDLYKLNITLQCTIQCVMNYPQWGVVRVSDLFKFWDTLPNLYVSNLICRVVMTSFIERMITDVGIMIRVTQPPFNCWDLGPLFRMGKARHFIFGAQVHYIKCCIHNEI